MTAFHELRNPVPENCIRHGRENTGKRFDFYGGGGYIRKMNFKLFYQVKQKAGRTFNEM